ncbi:MAG: hypothetical protein EOP83_02115 [Verrucomicrobiaceae bacterium]|nr:MAG: hypothetical protein EOP83_02115 [Verrucomicrobiaceae bacterium]
MIVQTEDYWSKNTDGYSWGPEVPSYWDVVSLDTSFHDLIRWIETQHDNFDAFFCWRPQYGTGRIEIALSNEKLAFLLKMVLG